MMSILPLFHIVCLAATRGCYQRVLQLERGWRTIIAVLGAHEIFNATNENIFVSLWLFFICWLWLRQPTYPCATSLVPLPVPTDPSFYLACLGQTLPGAKHLGCLALWRLVVINSVLTTFSLLPTSPSDKSLRFWPSYFWCVCVCGFFFFLASSKKHFWLHQKVQKKLWATKRQCVSFKLQATNL